MISQFHAILESDTGLYIRILGILLLGCVFLYNFFGKAQIDIILEWPSLKKGSISWIASKSEDYLTYPSLGIKTPGANFEFLGQPSKETNANKLLLTIMASKKHYKSSGDSRHIPATATIDCEKTFSFTIDSDALGSGEMVIDQTFITVQVSGVEPLRRGDDSPLSKEELEILLRGVSGTRFQLYTQPPSYKPLPRDDPRTRWINSNFVEDYFVYPPKGNQRSVEPTTELIEIGMVIEDYVVDDNPNLSSLRSDVVSANSSYKVHPNLAKLMFSVGFGKSGELTLDFPIIAVSLTNESYSNVMIDGKLAAYFSPISIIFGGLKPGRMFLDSNRDNLKIIGFPIKIEAGPEKRDLRPRKIDQWSWWAQALFWSLITLLASSTAMQVMKRVFGITS